ncbi:MAG: hypothetical protein ACJ8CR_02255, partial [Roseiflexaceae bacterium]
MRATIILLTLAMLLATCGGQAQQVAQPTVGAQPVATSPPAATVAANLASPTAPPATVASAPTSAPAPTAAPAHATSEAPATAAPAAQPVLQEYPVPPGSRPL